ncbi:uncharacterized protein LOC118754409 [Rhagoletis pomonella]|uniref:uncharacterized protein LOC118754409 n=1 Tax=Rhagoletis pomonella TaxID=28610 RepID=UPI00177C9E68|nr:uncharacterized protein LOC118754409 [Rhagoletis pomonella]XP_036345174.1 uncharacterized protein LOC118754409 [Rhagoletis pomonella]XP_036345175.1 uncharacterized protein LOC118754409 [Rhagoletis pomonella]
MEWTREKTLALINEYRQRRGLWDMTHDDYRKKDVKQNLLMEVSSSLGGNIPVGEIEKKFHTLRTQYHREINRNKRKEPYNSKWFGFKNLQFLSSPMARRLSRGRVKNEISEESTVTTKYIIRDLTTQQHENSGSSANSSNNLNEEFLTLHQKPTITIEAMENNTSRRNASRTRALEKLIEETTKDVEDIDDKPKISVSLSHHGFTAEMHPQEETNNHGNHSESHTIEDDDDHIESLQIQAEEEGIVYSTSSGANGCDGGPTNQQTIHQGPLPTRIIKIHRRDTCTEPEFFEEDAVATLDNKRVFYESTGQQHCATIVTSTPTVVSNTTNALMNPKIKIHQQKRQPQLPGRNLDENVCRKTGTMRDEFTTYGEYVSNEMRNITNREVLLGLKHKINTALFEAQMAELQK